MTYFPSIYSNEDNRQFFGTAISTSRLSHAYILEGPKGSGKHTFALQIAAANACKMNGGKTDVLPCGVCPSCKKILSENSSDMKFVFPSPNMISVDQIREIRSDMYLSSTEEDCKVYIIEEAQKMNLQAQNAILKVLEEPPTDVLIFLLTDNASSLLTTIRSRAQTIHMTLLDKTTLERAVERNEFALQLKRNTPNEYDSLIEACSGVLGSLLDMLDTKKKDAILKEREIVMEIVSNVLLHHRYVDFLPTQKRLPAKKDELIPIFLSVQNALRDLILSYESDRVSNSFYTSIEDIDYLTQMSSLARISKMYHLTEELLDSLSYNANINLTLTWYFTSLAQ